MRRTEAEQEKKNERLWTMIGGAGMVIFWIGACAADSENLILPAILILTGLGMCYGSARRIEE